MQVEPEARERLANVLAGFTEGLDTPELGEAKDLLVELLGSGTVA